MVNLVGDSNDPNIAAVFGDNTDGGTGVSGRSVNGYGTSGHSTSGAGVVGISGSGVGTYGHSSKGTGVYGRSYGAVGVWARSHSQAALVAESVSGGGEPAMIVRHFGTGSLIKCIKGEDRMMFEVANDGTVLALAYKYISDKNAKENFTSVNTLDILDKLASISIQSWNYKDDSSIVRHIGPTAQDFHSTFDLNGYDETHISSIDLHGVALAAIQGLNEKLKAENAELHANLAKLEARLTSLESTCLNTES